MLINVDGNTINLDDISVIAKVRPNSGFAYFDILFKNKTTLTIGSLKPVDFESMKELRDKVSNAWIKYKNPITEAVMSFNIEKK